MEATIMHRCFGNGSSLARCPEQSWVSALPHLYFLLLIPIQAHVFRTPKRAPSALPLRLRTRMVNVMRIAFGLLICLIISSLLELIFLYLGSGPPLISLQIDLIASICTWTLALISLVVAFYSGRRSNGFVVTYCVLQFVAQGLIFLKTVFDGQDLSPYLIARIVLLFILNGSFFGNDVIVVEKEGFSPVDTAGFHSRATLSWLSPIIGLGYRKALVFEDLFDLPRNTSTKYLMKKWDESWLRELGRENVRNGGRPSVFKVLTQVFLKSMVGPSVLRFVSEAMLFVNPVLLKFLIDFVSTPEAPLSFGLLCALCMFACSAVRSFLTNNYAYHILQNAVWMQSMLSTAIFRKTLRLSPVSRGHHTQGEVMNFLAVDAEKIVSYLPFLVETLTCPLDIVLSMIMLWFFMGWTAISGIILMACIVPFNYYTSMYIKKLQLKQLKVKDERTKLTNEVLNGMKLIKLYAWEEAFEREINKLRAEEVRILKKMNMTGRLVDSINSAAPYLVAMATFAFYVLISDENVLTPQIAFVALAIFNQLKMPMRILAMIINYLVQALVSLRRIEDFLVEEEMVVGQITAPTDPNVVLNMKHADFNWLGITSPPTVRIPELTVRRGEFVAIVGAVGAGKSSLLNAMLGEMCYLRGVVELCDKVAYVPQQPWLRNETLRQNILFGKPYDRKLYRRVTDSAQLRTDFEAMDHGDMTEIGENGVTLSGGQKARIGLARALYQEADLYLMDDCLSAVDAHVGSAMYTRVLGRDGILRNSTRILVTHGLQYTKECDRILVMKDGEIAESGTYSQLLEEGGLFAEMIQEMEKHKEEDKEEEAEEILDPGRLPSHRFSRMESASESVKDEAKLVQKETVETGRVSNAVYLAYLKAISLTITMIVSIFAIIHIIFAIARSLWLSAWSNGNVDDALQEKDTGTNLSVFSFLGVAEVITLLGIQIALVFGCQRASLALHSPVLHSILRSPMSFFDTTPVGRILNRLARDLEVIDNFLPATIGQFLNCAVQLFVVLVMISIATPIFIIAVVPVLLIYAYFLRYYISAARQLKRLESTRRSPLLSLFGETVQGASSIRAYKKSDDICVNFGEHVDQFARCKSLAFAGNRWLGLRLEAIAATLILLAAMCGVFSSRFSDISPAMLGMSISYALTVTELLYFGVRMSSELETYIVSVERVDEYTRLTPEAEWRSGSLSKEWPSRGLLAFKNFATKYRSELPLVIQNLTLTTRPGEKIGVVGRTGSGKSSLTMALYRIIEAQEGNISIDDVDISKIGLHDLREKISIIPQEPVLFSGTVRFNMDPFDKYTDKQLWDALEICQLKEYVSSLPGQLANKITEGGLNMSVGQRQLVCLGRALLRGGKILVLDEATAACDVQTDALVQRAVRENFPDSTVIAIAHRLDTIADYDRILVLDRGHLREFDEPKKLLETPGSLYASLVEKAKRSETRPF